MYDGKVCVEAIKAGPDTDGTFEHLGSIWLSDTMGSQALLLVMHMLDGPAKLLIRRIDRRQIELGYEELLEVDRPWWSEVSTSDHHWFIYRISLIDFGIFAQLENLLWTAARDNPNICSRPIYSAAQAQLADRRRVEE
jgi:hypothetical protein